MLLAIIFLILCIIISAIVTINAVGDIKDFFGNFFAFAFVFFIIHIFLCMLLLNSFTVDVGTTRETLYNIEGLESNMITSENLSGSFILGCGTIENKSSSTIKYYFFKETENGKSLESIVGENSEVYIQETNDMQPCLIKEYNIKRQNRLFEILFWKEEIKEELRTILVVPENTIKIEYNVEV